MKCIFAYIFAAAALVMAGPCSSGSLTTSLAAYTPPPDWKQPPGGGFPPGLKPCPITETLTTTVRVGTQTLQKTKTARPTTVFETLWPTEPPTTTSSPTVSKMEPCVLPAEETVWPPICVPARPVYTTIYEGSTTVTERTTITPTTTVSITLSPTSSAKIKTPTSIPPNPFTTVRLRPLQ